MHGVEEPDSAGASIGGYMVQIQAESREFRCHNCGRTIKVHTSSLVDKRNPELNLAFEGWFVLFHPQDWLSAWGGKGFCSLKCLTSWTQTELTIPQTASECPAS
jgi:hypothetical protein